MSQDVSDVLQMLRYELNYLEQGGFVRDRAMFGTQSPFLGTYLCLNHGDPMRPHACHECLLYQFVPADKQTAEFPCHHIPLNESGETVAELIEKKDPSRMAAALKQWLHSTITSLEALEQKAKWIQPDGRPRPVNLGYLLLLPLPWDPSPAIALGSGFSGNDRSLILRIFSAAFPCAVCRSVSVPLTVQ